LKMTADTNVLVRAATGDDARQSRVARDELARAEMVALTLPTLCELAWVLSRGYKIPADEISAGLRRLIDSANVVVNRPAAEAAKQELDDLETLQKYGVRPQRAGENAAPAGAAAAVEEPHIDREDGGLFLTGAPGKDPGMQCCQGK